MNSTSEIPTLHELLEQFSTTMLITHAGADSLRGRPMAISKLEPSCRVWLLTSQESAKMHQIEVCTAVHLCMQNDGDVYLSIEGEADIVHDQEKINEVWNESLRVWFPDGPEDPDIALIVVTPKDAEYWDHRKPNQFESVRPSGSYHHHGTKPEQH